MEHYGGNPDPQQYLPQCEPDGQFRYETPTQAGQKTASGVPFLMLTYLNCPSVRSSVMARPLTAGVWIRTAGRFLAPDRMTLSNLHVSIAKIVPVVKKRWICPHKSLSNHIPGLPSVAPPTVRPLPRPDVTPPPSADVTLLYAQGQKIGALPLNGTRFDAANAKTLLTLHVSDDIFILLFSQVGIRVSFKKCKCEPVRIEADDTSDSVPACVQGSIVVGLAYDCQENRVYWTDLSARTINRASLAPGAEPEILINTSTRTHLRLCLKSPLLLF